MSVRPIPHKEKALALTVRAKADRRYLYARLSWESMLASVITATVV